MEIFARQLIGNHIYYPSSNLNKCSHWFSTNLMTSLRWNREVRIGHQCFLLQGQVYCLLIIMNCIHRVNISGCQPNAADNDAENWSSESHLSCTLMYLYTAVELCPQSKSYSPRSLVHMTNMQTRSLLSAYLFVYKLVGAITVSGGEINLWTLIFGLRYFGLRLEI